MMAESAYTRLGAKDVEAAQALELQEEQQPASPRAPCRRRRGVVALLLVAAVVLLTMQHPRVRSLCGKHGGDEIKEVKPVVIVDYAPRPGTETEPPAECQTWFDGCNTCSRSTVGGALACTRMACFTRRDSECRKYFGDKELVEDKPARGPADEDVPNIFIPKDPTIRVPSLANKINKAAMARENVDAPASCRFWFTGCNKCRRSTPGAPLACTRMMCREGASGEAKCMAFFEDAASQGQDVDGIVPLDVRMP